MKLKPTAWRLALLTFLTLMNPFSHASTGGGDAGGGSEIALEFLGAASLALNEIKSSNPQAWSELNAAGVTEALPLGNIIVSKDPLYVSYGSEKQESTATNEPELGLVHIYSVRWDTIQIPQLKAALALHELASLKGLEKTGSYKYSGYYITHSGLKIEQLTALLTREKSNADIDFLREKFTQGTVPDGSALRLGEVWTCFRYLTGTPGFSMQRTNAFRFAVAPGSYYGYTNRPPEKQMFDFYSSTYDPVRNKLKDLSAIAFRETDSRKHTGEYSQEFIRVTPDGSLIVEQTYKTGYPVSSIAAPGEKVIAYEICKTHW